MMLPVLFTAVSSRLLVIVAVVAVLVGALVRLVAVATVLSVVMICW